MERYNIKIVEKKLNVIPTSSKNETKSASPKVRKFARELGANVSQF